MILSGEGMGLFNSEGLVAVEIQIQRQKSAGAKENGKELGRERETSEEGPIRCECDIAAKAHNPIQGKCTEAGIEDPVTNSTQS
jgi:hypothetical protein